MKASDLAARLDLELRGDDVDITGCSTLEEAGPNDISFLANPKYTKLVGSTGAGAVILSREQADLHSTCLISDSPYLDFARTVKLFATPEGTFSGRSESAFIHERASLDDDVTVYPHVTVGDGARIEAGSVLFSGVYVGENCRIGSGCVLYPNVCLMSNTSLGRNCVLHAGVVLGSDGFGFAQQGAGLEKVPQIGRVVVEDNVEIGANSTVDRAALGETRIGAGTKIDNLVQIGHNVHIGPNSILVAQVGIAGSSRLGKNVILAGQVGVAGHLEIGDNCRVGAQSGINKSLKPGTDVTGSPAVEHSKYLRMAALMPKLPDIYKRLKHLEAALQKLTRGSRGQGGPEHD
jgi:UDP-3-O-[3-hydroxymyristoyl] glucosamine N-acyltransferase